MAKKTVKGVNSEVAQMLRKKTLRKYEHVRSISKVWNAELNACAAGKTGKGNTFLFMREEGGPVESGGHQGYGKGTTIQSLM